MVFFCVVGLVLALSSTPALAGTLDTIGNAYKAASNGWESTLTAYAKSLFLKLALLELIWFVLMKLILAGRGGDEFFAALIGKMLPLLFFYAILLNFDSWVPAVISSFVQAGQGAGGTGALTPSSVLDLGLTIATTVWNAVAQNGIANVAAPMMAFSAVLGGVVIFLSFVFIAGQLLVTLIESYIVVSAGVLFLGFAGSSWTKTFAERFLSYVASVGIKLFMIYLIIGVGQQVAAQWVAAIPASPQASDYWAIAGEAVVYLLIAWQVPATASALMSGSVQMSLGGALMTGVGMATLAGGLGSLAGGAVGAARSAAGGAVSSTAQAAGYTAAAVSHGATVAGSAMSSAVDNAASSVSTFVRGLGESGRGPTATTTGAAPLAAPSTEPLNGPAVVAPSSGSGVNAPSGTVGGPAAPAPGGGGNPASVSASGSAGPASGGRQSVSSVGNGATRTSADAGEQSSGTPAPDLAAYRATAEASVAGTNLGGTPDVNAPDASNVDWKGVQPPNRSLGQQVSDVVHRTNLGDDDGQGGTIDVNLKHE